MSEEEMKALVEMNNMLKAKLEQQTKVYQQSLQEMQREIDDLQRNCDVFNEQMNDAVERATELQIENNKLKQDNQELQQENTGLQYENITLRSDFEAQAELTKKHKDKLNKIKEELLIWGEVINPTLQENILLTIESGE